MGHLPFFNIVKVISFGVFSLQAAGAYQCFVFEYEHYQG